MLTIKNKWLISSKVLQLHNFSQITPLLAAILDFTSSCLTQEDLELNKRPARDACLCMGELPAPAVPPAPAAPHFVFLITL